MFYYVCGELMLNDGTNAVIDCGGVGYALTVSRTTSASLALIEGEKKKKVRLYTYLAIRENDVELFGFYKEEELRLFKMLITVSGVGPKAATAILSVGSVTDLVRAIATGNQKLISTAQGVGPKTAARVILELKDKLGQGFVDLSDAGEENAALISAASQGSKLADAENALAVLGYSRQEIVSVLRNIDTEKNDLETVIKLALAVFLKK